MTHKDYYIFYRDCPYNNDLQNDDLIEDVLNKTIYMKYHLYVIIILKKILKILKKI